MTYPHVASHYGLPFVLLTPVLHHADFDPSARVIPVPASLVFYGSSFITDGCGEVQVSMGRQEEGFIAATFDLDQLMEDRLSWGLFRDRRPEMYGKLM